MGQRHGVIISDKPIRIQLRRWREIYILHDSGRILNGCQKGLQNITSSYGHHEKNIKFITSGRRPRVINLIFSSDDHNYE